MNRLAFALVAAVVCATTTLIASPAQAFGGGFVRAAGVCPTGKVVLGGGAQVVGEGSGPFLTAIQETAPGTSGGSPILWMTALKNNDLVNSHTIGLFAVCANSPFAGHQIVARNVTVGAHGFTRSTVVCPTGTVVLGGGATVIGEGAGNFNTLIRESAPGGQPTATSWLAAVANNDSSSHTIAITAVCANAPAGYEIVREDHTLLGNAIIRELVTCTSGKVSLAGGMQVVGEGSADFGTKLQESSPGSQPSSSSWLIAMENGTGSHTIGKFVICANAPAGYAITEKTVTVN